MHAFHPHPPLKKATIWKRSCSQNVSKVQGLQNVRWTLRLEREREKVEVEISEGALILSAAHNRNPSCSDPLPSPTVSFTHSFPNASYSQRKIFFELPALCGGNIIKVVKDVKSGEWGWHQANFTLGTPMAWPSQDPCFATQIKAPLLPH